MNQENRNIWILTAAQGLSRFGDHFQILAVTSLTYALTHSPMASALQLATSSLPYILFARWTGRLADRFDPRTVVGVVSVLQALLCLAFIPFHTVVPILALSFLLFTLSAFAFPARSALQRRLVSKDRLLQVNARMATVRGAVELFGPVAAGWAITHSGNAVAFAINAGSFLMPALAMLLVAPLVAAPVQRTQEAGVGPARNPVRAFLTGRPDLLLMLAANAAFQFGMWSVNALFYPYVADVLHAGPEVLGWTISVYFGANLITGMLVERLGRRLHHPVLLYASLLFGTLVWMGYTVARTAWLAVLLSLLDGLVFTLASTLYTTRIQEEAPPELIGRVHATAQSTQEVASLIGMLLGGWIATARSVLMGFRVTTALAMALVLAVALADLYRQRKALGVNDLRSPSV